MSGITWSAKIDRESVLHAIGVKSLNKIPEDMDATFEKVTILKREYIPRENRDRDAKRAACFKFTEPQLVDVTLIVEPIRRGEFKDPTTGKMRPFRSSRHRTFILCPRCGAKTPTGRFHQHINTKVCDEGYDKRLDQALTEIDLSPATNQSEIDRTIKLLNDVAF